MNPQGLYTLTSYGKTLERKMEAVSNNLANADTVGYKQDQPSFQMLFSQTMGVASQSDEEQFSNLEHLAPYTGVGTFHVSTADMGKDFSQGRIFPTGNDLDFTITGKDGFFSVTTPQGERFTRAGNFRLNRENQIVTSEGYTLNGKDGNPLKVEGEDLQLAEDGTLIVDGQPVGGLKVVTFPFPERMQKLGGALFAPIDEENNARILEDVRLVQGMLESSNVNTVQEMVKMIEANRAYSSMEKAMSSQDEMNQRAMSLSEMR